MGRILFFLILLLVIVGAVIWNRRNRVPRRQAPEVLPRSQTPTPMIHCPVCGCAFPKDEAVLGDGVAYCSEKCRQAVRNKTPQS